MNEKDSGDGTTGTGKIPGTETLPSVLQWEPNVSISESRQDIRGGVARFEVNAPLTLALRLYGEWQQAQVKG